MSDKSTMVVCLDDLVGEVHYWAEQSAWSLKEHDKQIRADAIEDAIHHLDNSKVNCHEDYVDGIDFAIGVLGSIAEKLKENK